MNEKTLLQQSWISVRLCFCSIVFMLALYFQETIRNELGLKKYNSQ